MEAILKGEPKEIATLVLAVQGRQANDGANVDEVVKAVMDAQIQQLHSGGIQLVI